MGVSTCKLWMKKVHVEANGMCCDLCGTAVHYIQMRWLSLASYEPEAFATIQKYVNLRSLRTKTRGVAGECTGDNRRRRRQQEVKGDCDICTRVDISAPSVECLRMNIDEQAFSLGSKRESNNRNCKRKICFPYFNRISIDWKLKPCSSDLLRRVCSWLSLIQL